MSNITKYATTAEYEAATLDKPAVTLTQDDGEVHFDDVSWCRGWTDGDTFNVNSTDYANGEKIVDPTVSKSMFGNNTNNILRIEVRHLDMSGVTNINAMFNRSAFSTLKYIDLSNWNSGDVTSNARNLFSNCCTSLEVIDLTGTDFHNVTDFSQAFCNCTSLRKIIGIENLDVSSCTAMGWSYGGMFQGCSSLKKLDLSAWDVSSLTTCIYWFRNCSSLEELILPSGMSKVTNMKYAFEGTKLKTLDLTNQDFAALQYQTGYYSGLFGISTLESIDLGSNTFPSLKEYGYMFAGASKLKTLDVSNFCFDSLYQPDGADTRYGNNGVMSIFSGCSSLETITGLDKWDFSKVKYAGGIFSSCSSLTDLSTIAGWDVSNVTTMSYMFYNCTGLTDLSCIASWDVSNVTAMSYMFYNCTGLTELDLSGIYMGNVTEANYIFCNCCNMVTLNLGTQDWGSFNSAYTLYTNRAWSMFTKCYALTTITGTVSNIGKGYESGDTNIMLNVSWSPLTKESALVLINGLYDFTTNGTYTATATLAVSYTTYNLLTDEDMAIATNKGWIIST